MESVEAAEVEAAFIMCGSIRGGCGGAGRPGQCRQSEWSCRLVRLIT